MSADVLITPLKQIESSKGSVMHALKCSDDGYTGFGEAYFSTVATGSVKGWKRHRDMTCNLVVPVGAIKFVILDPRASSQSRKKYIEITLSSENYSRLTIPPGFWVAFKGLGNQLNLLMNVADHEHNPAEADNQPIESFDYDWN